MTNEHYLEVAKECGACIRKFEFPSCGYERIEMSPKELSAYTARICAEKDAEIEREKQYSSMLFDQINYLKQQLSAANAAIVMKDSILNDFYNSYSETYSASSEGRAYLTKVKAALSTSPESIAAWEAEKLLPLQRQNEELVESLELYKNDYAKSLDENFTLQRQVAMLRESAEKLTDDVSGFNVSGVYYSEFKENKKLIENVYDAISNTQETAEAYDRELTEPLKKRITELEAKT